MVHQRLLSKCVTTRNAIADALKIYTKYAFVQAALSPTSRILQAGKDALRTFEGLGWEGVKDTWAIAASVTAARFSLALLVSAFTWSVLVMPSGDLDGE